MTTDDAPADDMNIPSRAYKARLAIVAADGEPYDAQMAHLARAQAWGILAVHDALQSLTRAVFAVADAIHAEPPDG